MPFIIAKAKHMQQYRKKCKVSRSICSVFLERSVMCDTLQKMWDVNTAFKDISLVHVYIQKLIKSSAVELASK